MVSLADLPEAPEVPGPDPDTLLHRQMAFGYTLEDLKFILGPMGSAGEEAIGSMGTDTPLAVLSDRAQPLFNYFKQLFAQVTNPPLDAIREELVTSVFTGAGGEGNLLEPKPESCRQIALDIPVLDNDELARLKLLEGWRGFKSATVPMLFVAAEGARGLEAALRSMFDRACAAIEDGANLIILSDRGVSAEMAPIPSLLACSGLHHEMVRRGLRSRAGLVVECGDAREVHHFALLLGYGAGTINPYVAFETLDEMIGQGMITGIDHDEAVYRYRKAIKKGVVKVMSKMGISTIQSYRGAQIFEAIGLNEEFVRQYFDKTPSRVGGIGLEEVAEETLYHHHRAYASRDVRPVQLLEGGQYQWRRDGEFHLFNPETVFRLQHATQAGRYDIFKKYTRSVDDQTERLCTLRGLFTFKFDKCQSDPDRGGRAGRVDRQAVRDRRHELRLDLRRGARDPGDRHEPAGRPVQHRRGGRGPRAVQADAQRRQPAQRDQAGGLGAVRRHQRIPGQLRRAPDQDGAGGQAGRGGAAPGPQGLAVDRQGPVLDARRRPDQPAAAPRHLLDRRPRPVDLRPEEQQPPGADQRQAGGRDGRGDGRGGRGQGAQRRRADQRPRRRHRRQPADVAQARRASPGSSAWPRRSRRSS